jgi:hypothetical protein
LLEVVVVVQATSLDLVVAVLVDIARAQDLLVEAQALSHNFFLR